MDTYLRKQLGELIKGIGNCVLSTTAYMHINLKRSGA